MGTGISRPYVNSKQLAWKIHVKTGIPKTDVLLVLDAIEEAIDSFKDSESIIHMSSFLSFQYKNYDKRMVRLPDKWTAELKHIPLKRKKKLIVKVKSRYQDKLNGVFKKENASKKKGTS